MRRLIVILVALAVLMPVYAQPAEAIYIFVRARDKTPNANLSAEEQAAAQSARGDIVEVVEDSAFPGGCENAFFTQSSSMYPAGGPYVAVYLEGITKAQARKYIANHFDGETVVLYRAWSFLQDNLPTGVRQTLASDGCYQTTFAAMKSYLWDKVNEVTEQ